MLAQPALGRFWRPEEDTQYLTVISYDYWQSGFGGAADVIGRTISLYNTPYTIVGVAPPDFQYPSREFKIWNTMGPAVAAAAATDRLVWNHGGATSQLARPRFPRVVNVPSPASTYFRGSLQAVRAADPDARTVALLHGETGFARDVAGGARAAAAALAFEVRAVGFPPGQAADA